MDQIKPIRLALNTTALLSQKTGIGRYTYELAQRLGIDPSLSISFYYGAFWSNEVKHNAPPAIAGLLPLVRQYVPFSYELKSLIQHHRFRRQATVKNFDLYHEPNNAPLPFDGPMVLTVHDLSWIRYPSMHPPERVRAMNRNFEPGLRRASRIITVSEFVKRELVQEFGLRPEIIHTTPLGASPSFRPRNAQETSTVLQSHGLEHGRYILALGTLEPRKNLEVAIAAFSRLPSKIQNQYPLVLVGMSGWLTESIERLIQPLRAKGLIKQLGFLPDHELPFIVAGAACMIYPSVYEGFGLPPLEAMSCGVPVITSNAASLPEVVGNSGIMLDPQDVVAFTQAMEQLLNTPDMRLKVGEQGMQRSRSFSWERCATQTQDVYRQAVS